MSGPKLDLIQKDRTKSISFSLSFQEEMLEIIPTPYGFVLELEDYPNSGELGGPALPSKVLKIALPPNSKASKLLVTATKTVEIGDGPIFIAPNQPLQIKNIELPMESKYVEKFGKIRPFSQELDIIKRPIDSIRTIQVPEEKLYQVTSENLKPFATMLNTIQMGTVNIVHVEVNPVRYTTEGRLQFATEIEVEVFYSDVGSFEDHPTDDHLPRNFKSIRNKAQAIQLSNLAHLLVINPDMITDITHLFAETISELDYLIITSNTQWNQNGTAGTSVGDLKSVFQRLADWKELKGLKAHVVTVDEIVNGHFGNFNLSANGLQARDLQEILRNFLKWAHLNWGISWVLLGGDVNIIPPRQVPGASEGHINTASDNPPENNKSFWTGTFLKMNVNNPGVWWPGNTERFLLRPDTGQLIPFDNNGSSNINNPGWYYCTNNTYNTRTTARTNFVRVNGPASLLNVQLQWIYQWNNIPTDLYYSSLVSPAYNRSGRHDWDLNNNGLYGQHNSGTDFDGDVYDADVSLGRAPVSSVTQAEAFVNKVIAYETYRKPNGSYLSTLWPRKLAFVSSNWGGRFNCSSTTTNPPENRRYFHKSGNKYSIINTRNVLEEYRWRLFSQISDSFISHIPYTLNAESAGFGWFFAKSASDPTPSYTYLNYGFVTFKFPKPTQWIAVYGGASILSPEHFVFDVIGADGSMKDQETLRKQMAQDFPSINKVQRFYQDEADLPQADRHSPPIDHLTESNLRTYLNQGPAIVSLSGHGTPDGCCHLNGAMASSLTNGNSTFIAFADSCLTNQFDGEDAVSERLLYNPNGGAVGYVGNTRFSWIGVGDNFQRRFFKTLTLTRHLGHLNDVRTTMINESTGYYRLYNKWVVFAQNLLGDPEMEVWTGSPQILEVTHASGIFTGFQNFMVTVKKDGSPVPYAKVSLKINQEKVIHGTADGTGRAYININPTSIGIMKVVVTADHCIPYIKDVEIKQRSTCVNSLTCQLSLNCGPMINCGPRLVCGIRLACGNNILGPCRLRLTCQPILGPIEGCPNITPVDFDKFKDVLEKLRFNHFGELADKWNEPEVKRFLRQLPRDQFKELKLLIDRIRNEG